MSTMYTIFAARMIERRDAKITTLLEQNTELLEALRLMCNGIEQSHNDNVVGASMRASVPTLRAIIAKCEAQIPA